MLPLTVAEFYKGKNAICSDSKAQIKKITASRPQWGWVTAKMLWLNKAAQGIKEKSMSPGSCFNLLRT